MPIPTARSLSILATAAFGLAAHAAPSPCERVLHCELSTRLDCASPGPASGDAPQSWGLFKGRNRIAPAQQSDTGAAWSADQIAKLSSGVYLARLDAWDPTTGSTHCAQAEVVIELDRARANPFPPAPQGCGVSRDFPHLQYFSDAIARLTRETGSQDGQGVTVAVLDTGINPFHPDFLEIGPGWDFVHDSPQALDDSGHGTHVAGLIAGTRSGLAPRVRLMPIKVLDLRQNAKLEHLVAGIHFAVDHGADIINLSAGSASPRFREPLRQALEYALAHGVLVVVAAGNQARDLGQHPYYPASLELPNLLAVGAVDGPYSNHGPGVSVFAPGGNPQGAEILSTHFWPSGDCSTLYASHFGTSMAAPLVTGFAALLKSAHRDWSPQALKARIRQDLRSRSL